MNNSTNKICPLLSQGTELVPCNKQCAWYCDDGIPSICMVKDIAFTLSRIEHTLEDIKLLMPECED